MRPPIVAASFFVPGVKSRSAASGGCSMAVDNDQRWPELSYGAWKDTRDTLHLWRQIAGKIRLALTPWLNHSWHVTLYVTARGLTTSPIPWRGSTFQIDFDFIDDVPGVSTSDGAVRQFALAGHSVASFYEMLMAALAERGIRVA